MVAERLISPTIPVLHPNDTAERALSLMEENHVTQLPMVADDKYSALVSEQELLDAHAPEAPIALSDANQYRPAVMAYSHPFEALKLVSKYNLDIVPVVDSASNYIGSITKTNLLKYLTENGSFEQPGGVLVLEVEPHSYSLSEIARLCENEEVIITSANMRSDEATGKIEVNLKTNRPDLQALVHSFERHSYLVKEVFGTQSDQEDILDRYNLLMTYLNM